MALDIEQTLLTQSQALGKIEQKLDDLSTGLLGGEGRKGAIPFLHEEHEKLDSRVLTLEQKKNWATGWIAGVGFMGTIFGGVVSWLLHWFKR